MNKVIIPQIFSKNTTWASYSCVCWAYIRTQRKILAPMGVFILEGGERSLLSWLPSRHYKENHCIILLENFCSNILKSFKRGKNIFQSNRNKLKSLGDLQKIWRDSQTLSYLMDEEKETIWMVPKENFLIYKPNHPPFLI